MRTLTVILFVSICVSLGHAQKVQRNSQAPSEQQDEKILNVVSNARGQVDNFTDTLAIGSLIEEMQQGKVDRQNAERLLSSIETDKKNEQRWEETLWTIPASELLPGEFIQMHLGTFLMMEGTGRTLRKRFPFCAASPGECDRAADTEKALYVIQAPLEVKAHILMEGLRHGISHYEAVQYLRGKPTTDPFVTAWNSACFDARNVYCRHSTGAKYVDLSSHEQVCR